MTRPNPPDPSTDAWLDWPTEADCERAAQRLARLWSASDAGADAGGGTLTLDGPLGAGKTAFSRHLLRALGVAGAIRSPTYTLVEPYAVQRLDGSVLRLAHCDFYRFEDPAEWEEAGLRELFTSAALRLVEWPSRAEGRLGPVDLALRIEPVLRAPTEDEREDEREDELKGEAGEKAGGEADPASAPRRVQARALSAAGRQWLLQLFGPAAPSAGEAVA